MKLVVLGSTGMLGKALVVEAKKRKIQVFGFSKTTSELALDITNDNLLNNTLKNLRPDVVINTAAIVSIDLCEQNPELAYLTNSRAVSKIAEFSESLKAYFIQISTDHYYTGDKDKKHSENEKVHILNEYARTKYAGEAFALLYNKTLIVRTNILGFRNSATPTFIEWIIRSLKNRSPITLFSDYFISGIHVTQLSRALFDIITKKPVGRLNIASSEVYSKKELIESIAKSLKLSLKNTNIGSVFDNMQVHRAESLGLNVSKTEELLGYRLPDLKQVVKSIMSDIQKR